MQKYQDSVQDRNGNAVVGASVLVKTLAGATATIYSDNGVTAASNPLTTDSKGHFEFYAANGRYTFEISGAGLAATHTVTDVLLDDETTETAIAGNLVFRDAAARIVGDFYNATHANRVIATSDAANKKAEFGVAPTTTSPTTDGNARAGYNAYNQSAVDNAAYAAMTIDYDKMRFSSGANGAGTVLPMSWEIGGTEVAAMSTAGIQTIAGGGIYGTNPDSITFTSTAASAGKTLLVGNSNQGESARYVMSCITSGASVRTGSFVIDGQDNGALKIYSGGTLRMNFDRSSGNTFVPSGNFMVGTTVDSTSYLLQVNGLALASSGIQAGANPTAVSFTSTAASEGKTSVVGSTVNGVSARYVLGVYDSGGTPRDASIAIDAQDTGALNVYVSGTKFQKYDRNNAIISFYKTIGYGDNLGAGGTAAQATSRTDTVTLDKSCGRITTHDASLAAGAKVVFELANSQILSVYDQCPTVINSTALADIFRVRTVAVKPGGALIEVENVSTAATTQSLQINFAVFGGTIS